MPKVIVGNNANADRARIALADDMWLNALIDDAEGNIVNNVGTLRHEDHVRIQDQLIAIRRASLSGIADLIAAGLTAPQTLDTMLAGYETTNEFQAAEVSMNDIRRQDNNSNYVPSYVPLPVVFSGWSIPWRQDGFAYKDSAGLSESVRQVAEASENMLFNGETRAVVNFNSANQTVYGYTNHPDRQTFTIGDWTAVAGTAVVTDVLAMVEKLYLNTFVNANQKSLVLYIARDFWMSLQEDYSTTKGDNTILDRIMAIPEIIAVRPALKMATGTAVLVEMADRTVQMGIASDIVTIPHEQQSRVSNQEFTTYAVWTPMIKSDRNSITGICHGTQ